MFKLLRNRFNYSIQIYKLIKISQNLNFSIVNNFINKKSLEKNMYNRSRTFIKSND